MSSQSLGKRKARDEDGDGNDVKHGSTLFVSNIPYSVTSTDLQTLFSDIAPVRSAFVVLEHGTGVSKGVGYVSFAVREDAQAAHDKISSDGLSLLGRSLRVVWAENKPREGKPNEEPSAADRKQSTKSKVQPRIPHLKASHDPLAIRTVILSGLPPQGKIDGKSLWKKVRKYRGAEKVDWPAEGENGEEDYSTANVLFESPSSAQEAVNKLHAHIFKGCMLSATLKKRLDSLAKAAPTTAKLKTSGSNSAISGAPSHASRLIVRNLPFEATEQDLRAVFLPYGPIYSIHIPVAEDSKTNTDTAETGSQNKTKRTKGFGFVWMISKNDAEKALEGCNGTTIRAGMATSIAEDKQKKKKQRRIEKKKRDDEKNATKGEGEDAVDADDNALGRKNERVIVVDWVLSKDRWEEEKAKMDVEEVEAHEDEDVGMGSAKSGEESDLESRESDSDEEGLGVHEGSDDSERDEDEDDEEVPAKPQLPPPEAGTTLFVRNVPFEATEDELRTLFRTFGPLRYARVTMDHSTGRSRGTGFACFWNKEDADKVITHSELLRAETVGTEGPKKNPFKLPSLLTPDPSSSFAQSLVLQGRTLDVVRAVTRDEAGKLKEDGERKREKADKRNMYLLREGVILPNTPAAEFLAPTDVERRTASFDARRALLKSNPLLYISRTRLSVRQIPTYVTERVLKRLAIHAVREFEKEVKAGRRIALSGDELAEPVIEEGDEKENKKLPTRKANNHSKSNLVKQAKIVRQQDRVDPLTNKGRSKGYGFVEMHTHADALRVLRWANNNSEVGALFTTWWRDEMSELAGVEKKKGKGKDVGRLKKLEDAAMGEGNGKARGSLIVEFSIENVQVVKRRAVAKATQSKEESPSKKRRIEKPKNIKN